MSSLSKVLIFLMLLVPLSGISQPGIASVYLVDFDEAEAEFLMLQAINTVRYRENLPLVAVDENLSRSCRRHALDMAQRDYFDHYTPEGQSPDDRARRLGVPNRVSENIGIIRTFGQGLDDVVNALMRGFLESEEHRANLLDPNVTHVGIGFYQDVDCTNHRLSAGGDPNAVFRGFGTVLAVQDFYRRDVALIEPDPYEGVAYPGEFLTLKLKFAGEVEEAFLRITPKAKPMETYEVPMLRITDGFRARFAIGEEGDFTIGIYANSPSADWFYREQGQLELRVQSYSL